MSLDRAPNASRNKTEIPQDKGLEGTSFPEAIRLATPDPATKNAARKIMTNHGAELRILQVSIADGTIEVLHQNQLPESTAEAIRKNCGPIPVAFIHRPEGWE